jgi:hypothetical protein
MDVVNHFKLNNIYQLLTSKENDIINYIETKYNKNNTSTIKTKLCCIYKCYKILNLESNSFKKKIDEYKTQTCIKLDKTKESNKKDENDGIKLIEEFKKHYENLHQQIKNDTSLLTNWTQKAQLYCVLKLYSEYGVLRSDEILKCLITDNDDNANMNYINIKNKKLVINNHKNDRKGPKIIDLDETFLKYLKPGLDKYLISNSKGELYQSSSSFAIFFMNTFGYNVYDLKKINIINNYKRRRY